MGQSNCNSSRGFTLIEVLIALAITAAVATLAFSSLSAVLGSVESLRREGGRIAEVNRAWTVLTRDINQLVPRPVRNEFGAVEPAMASFDATGPGLNLTRAGWHNPNRQVRSTLQRVRYQLEDDILWRESYAALDRTEASEPQRARLLEAVESFELAFLSRSTPLPQGDLNTGGWLRAWPQGQFRDSPQEGSAPPAAFAPEPSAAFAPESVPEALEIRLVLKDWGELRWLYDLPVAP